MPFHKMFLLPNILDQSWSVHYRDLFPIFFAHRGQQKRCYQRGPPLAQHVNATKSWWTHPAWNYVIINEFGSRTFANDYGPSSIFLNTWYHWHSHLHNRSFSSWGNTFSSYRKLVGTSQASKLLYRTNCSPSVLQGLYLRPRSKGTMDQSSGATLASGNLSSISTF